MAGLVPFNRKNTNFSRTGTGFDDFYDMLDDFFTGTQLPVRNLLKDTFKIDIVEKDDEYLIEAELPGIKKDEINIEVEDEFLNISVNRSEESNKNGKNYIHRERRFSAMSRRVRLSGADLDKIKAKLEDGVLSVMIPKDVKVASSRKIAIE